MSNELTTIDQFNGIPITKDTIKKYICPTATDQEIVFFMELCKRQGLNPFIKDAYLIKYGTSPASTVVGKDVFLKRANGIPGYRGYEAGIIVLSDNQVVNTKGILPPGAKIIGGWAKVYSENREPLEIEVNLSEYDSGKALWASKTATMIRKVALVQALREAFPEIYQGLYDEAEIEQPKRQNIVQQSKVVIDDNPIKLAEYLDTVDSITDTSLLTDLMDQASSTLSENDYKTLQIEGRKRFKEIKAKQVSES